MIRSKTKKQYDVFSSCKGENKSFEELSVINNSTSANKLNKPVLIAISQLVQGEKIKFTEKKDNRKRHNEKKEGIVTSIYVDKFTVEIDNGKRKYIQLITFGDLIAESIVLEGNNENT